MAPELSDLLSYVVAQSVLVALGLAIWLRSQSDERRWKREREAEESAGHAAE